MSIVLPARDEQEDIHEIYLCDWLELDVAGLGCWFPEADNQVTKCDATEPRGVKSMTSGRPSATRASRPRNSGARE